MNRENNSNNATIKDDKEKLNVLESDADYNRSSEVEAPNPSTATPNIPDEMPVR